MSDDISVNQVAETHKLVHLSWNETGSELAIVDCSGRISVFSISTALSILSLSRSALVDPDDDGAQVVGLLWLNMNRTVGCPL
jgi:mediator of RNA polymerase II transcription subunit 16